MAIYTPPFGGKIPSWISMYQVEVVEASSRHTLSARLPLLGVATMPRCHWTPETFDKVGKLAAGEVYMHCATAEWPVEIKIERVC